MNVAVSVITYELAKRLGNEGATEEFFRQVTAPDVAGTPMLPAAWVVRELRKLADVALLHDAGGTSIGIARSRLFTKALETRADLYVSVDDDLEATPATLRHLLGAVDPETPQIVIVPYWLRQQTPMVAITLDDESKLSRQTSTGAELRRALTGGFGLVAMTRPAMTEMVRAWPDLQFVDNDGHVRLGMFIEFIRAGWWYREDFAFFSRVPRHVRVEALLSGRVTHAGRELVLGDTEQQPMMEVPRDFLRTRNLCGQEGGYVDELGNHPGRCDFQANHEGPHSWEPADGP